MVSLANSIEKNSQNPYYLKTKPTFQKFLTETQESNRIQVYDIHTGKILEYKNTHNNTVLVNLAFLQKKEKMYYIINTY